MVNVGLTESSVAQAFTFMPQPHVVSVPPQPIALPHPQHMIMPYQRYFVSMQPSYILSPTSTLIPQKSVGSVRKWFTEKGFGFITKPDGCDVFVHHSSIRCKGRASLAIGEGVEFNIFISDDGREKALDVTGPGGTYVKGSREFYIASADFDRKKRVCFKFRNSGICKFGAKCKYSHESPLRRHGGNAFEGEGKKPCFAFQNMGHCKFGDGCRFVHGFVE